MPGGFNPRMIHWHRAAFAGDFFQRDWFRAVAACGHHYTKNAFVDQICARAAEPRGEQTVGRRRRAATLDVAENRHTRFKVGEFFQLPGEPEGVAGVPGFERGKFHLGLFLVLLGAGAFALGFGGAKGAGVIHTHRAFGHGHDAEIGSEPAATFDGLGDLLNTIRYFRNQDYIRTAYAKGLMTRAVVLRREAEALRVAPVLRDLAPKLRTDIDRIINASTTAFAR